ncbi:MAG: multiprotein bridging factor aMBF1 [Halobacteriota archaeon]|nr:multiprotein bridging factor aMBF1 [Halobacteriota archaeon]
MQCEICGAEIYGRPTRIEMDGSKLSVCNACVRYGNVIYEKPSPQRRNVQLNRSIQSSTIEVEEIVQNYGVLIKNAREKLGLSREDFAKKLNEKASLISKIERSEMVPDDELRKKIEKMIKVKLTERLEPIDLGSSKGSGGLTLGDIALIKKK